MQDHLLLLPLGMPSAEDETAPSALEILSRAKARREANVGLLLDPNVDRSASQLFVFSVPGTRASEQELCWNAQIFRDVEASAYSLKLGSYSVSPTSALLGELCESVLGVILVVFVEARAD